MFFIFDFTYVHQITQKSVNKLKSRLWNQVIPLNTLN